VHDSRDHDLQRHNSRDQDSPDRDLRDRELGMQRPITRRDFLNGVAVTAGVAMMPWDLVAASA
jgi:hypothetical protein